MKSLHIATVSFTGFISNNTFQNCKPLPNKHLRSIASATNLSGIHIAYGTMKGFCNDNSNRNME